MRILSRLSVLAVLALAVIVPSVQAQTADDIVEKHLAAVGGRAVLAKLQTRVATGTITVSVQGMEISGPIEVDNKAPNKSRSYSRLDATQMGGPEIVVEQRCDGKVAYVSNSMTGERDLTGSQLQHTLNARFPSPLLDYKTAGAKVELVGKDKVGDRDVYVLLYTPKEGPASRNYFDAETYYLLRTVTKIEVPELGGETETTTDLQDYRDVDGLKMPFTTHVVTPQQAVTISLQKVENNKPIDDAMFSKPAAK